MICFGETVPLDSEYLIVGDHADGPAWWWDPAGMSKTMVEPDQEDQQRGTSGNVLEDIIELVVATGKM